MRRTFAVLVMFIIAVAGLGAAHAAAMNIGTASLSAFSVAERCSASSVPITAGAITAGTATTVVVTIPAGCNAKQGVLRLGGVSGPLAPADTTFTFPATGTSTTITVPDYRPVTVTGVALTLGTWGMRTSWAYTFVPAPTNPVTCSIIGRPTIVCAAAVQSFTTSSTIPGGPIDRFDMVVDLSTTGTPNKMVWQATFDFTDGQYPFTPQTVSSDGRTVLATGTTCQPLTVQGNPATPPANGAPWREIRTGYTRQVVVTGYLNAAPAGNLITCP